MANERLKTSAMIKISITPRLFKSQRFVMPFTTMRVPLLSQAIALPYASHL